jgi:hypothetical protein
MTEFRDDWKNGDDARAGVTSFLLRSPFIRMIASIAEQQVLIEFERPIIATLNRIEWIMMTQAFAANLQ